MIASTRHPVKAAGQSGNILFLILIAAAAFSALTLAVSYGSRTADNDISDSNARIAASELINMMVSRTEAYSRLRLLGCKAEEISMGRGENGAALTPRGNGECDIESPNGGNIPAPYIAHNFQNVPAGQSVHKERVFYRSMSLMTNPAEQTFVMGVDHDNRPKYMITLNFVVDRICEQYNRTFAINGIPADDGNTIGDEAPELKGKQTACRATSTLGNQIYYIYDTAQR